MEHGLVLDILEQRHLSRRGLVTTNTANRLTADKH